MTASLLATCRFMMSSGPRSVPRTTARYGPKEVDLEPLWASEAACDGWALRAPDPTSRTGESIRVIGFSPSAVRLLMVVLIPEEHPPAGLWWGVTARPANQEERGVYERNRP